MEEVECLALGVGSRSRWFDVAVAFWPVWVSSNANECRVDGGWSVDEMISISRVNEYCARSARRWSAYIALRQRTADADLESLAGDALDPFVAFVSAYDRVAWVGGRSAVGAED